MDLHDLLGALTRLNQAPAGGAGKRWPHKPLLLLFLLGRFQQTGSSSVTFEETADDLARLIADYAPALPSGKAQSRDRAAMPFVHLERVLWHPRWADGTDLSRNQPERQAALVRGGAHGSLTTEVLALLADPLSLSAAARTLIDRNFTPSLEDALLSDVGLDLTPGGPGLSLPRSGLRRRDPKFAEKVYIAYDYSCAMCGYDGGIGRSPVGLEAAHILWHSQNGPDIVSNACALCSLHHALLDRGVLGLTEEREVAVSGLFVTRSAAGQAIRDLHGQPLRTPSPGHDLISGDYISWHTSQVFQGGPTAA